eukprot:737769-Amphidinium_carterae.1
MTDWAYQHTPPLMFLGLTVSDTDIRCNLLARLQKCCEVAWELERTAAHDSACCDFLASIPWLSEQFAREVL